MHAKLRSRLERVSQILTRMLVAMHIVQVARLLAQDHAVQALVHEAIVVLHKLPYQLRRHGLNTFVKTPNDQALPQRGL